jgi:hypothetical protein
MTVETRNQSLTALGRAVLGSVAYSDVFDFPVTAAEVCRSLPIAASVAEVEAMLASLPGITRIGQHHMLAGCEALSATRARRAAASRRLMRQAEAYGRVIARLPFVRMVAVTGSLAVDNAEDGDDIDYLIVTAPGRVWLARALAIAVVRVAALRRLTLCPNYVLSESALALPDRDPYTARELQQMRPLAGHDVYGRMLAANAWCLALLPNWQPEIAQEEGGPGPAKLAAEVALRGWVGDALERWLLRRKGRELRGRVADPGETAFDADVCKGHFEGHRARLQAALAQRLAELGLAS